MFFYLEQYNILTEFRAALYWRTSDVIMRSCVMTGHASEERLCLIKI